MKPQTRALSASVNVAAKQGDETVNEVKMTYSEAKKFEKELEEEANAEESDAEEETDDADAADEEAESDASESDGE